MYEGGKTLTSVVLQINIEETVRKEVDLFGEGVDEEPKGLLFFDKTNGAVYVLRPVDYEQKNILMVNKHFTLVFYKTDSFDLQLWLK